MAAAVVPPIVTGVPAFVGPVTSPGAIVSPEHLVLEDVALRSSAVRAAAPASRAAVRQMRKVQARSRVIARQRAAARVHAVRVARSSGLVGTRRDSSVSRSAAGSGHGVRRTVTHRSTRHVVKRQVRRAAGTARRGLGAVVAYARAQVGKPYVMGAAGPGAYDCSGLAMRAYQRVGVRLPHSSGGIAGRAYTVSRSSARAGDLVLGPGHVGIYAGGGMMIDAGNRRVGVVYRHMYSGLRVARLRGL